MSAKALFIRRTEIMTLVALAFAANSGDVLQLADGRAGIVNGLKPSIIGDDVAVAVEGHFEITKAANINILKGGRVFWDRVNGNATFNRVTGGFYLGVAIADAAAADATVSVDLNVLQAVKVDMVNLPWTSVAVGSATNTRDGIGTRSTLAVIATSEAEKIDALSNDAVAVADGPILECRLTTVANGSTSAVDINLGLANGTHASDADAITEHVFFHIDGGSQVINGQSKDGTTTVASVTTTVSITDGTFVEFWIDARNPAAVKLYLDGVAVLATTGFKLDKATGPLKALIHIEKSTGTATGSIAVDFCRLRSTDLS